MSITPAKRGELVRDSTLPPAPVSGASDELGHAREKLLLANEELRTLNDELRLRNTALVEINDDIENLLGAVEIPILFVDTALRLRRFNLSAAALFGLEAHSVGAMLHESKSLIDLPHVARVVGAVMASGSAVEAEVQDACGDWRLLRVRPYRTRNGSADGAIVAAMDINLLKRSVLRAEEAARRANMLSRASALLASSLDYETTLESLAQFSTAEFADWCAVDLVNDDGTIRHLTVSHCDPDLRELALLFQQESFSEPERAPGAPQALRLRRSVLLTDLAEWQLTGVQPEAKITQLIGALGVRSLISVPLLVRERVFGTTTFSSSSRRYDAADLQLAEELSQRAATAIDTAMLFREAESANRFKDAFLGTVAHELRTPLTSIIGWVQLSKGVPELAGEAFVRIEESVNLLKAFTEDLLDVTRIREQKLKLDVEDLDLVAVVRSALEITSSAAILHGVQVRSSFEVDSAVMSGDSVRLLQVAWNLLSNAIKFTPCDGVIDVRLRRENDVALLSVTDTGVGITAEFLPQVFEIYRQADQPGGHRPGLGIGLSIVEQIVKLHQGTVRVESPGLGLGATFLVSLPLQPLPSEESSDSAARRVVAESRSNERRSTRLKIKRQD